MQHYQDSVQYISLVDQKVPCRGTLPIGGGSATPAVHIKEPGNPGHKLPLCTVHEKVAVGLGFKIYSIIIIVITLLTFSE